MGDWMVCEDDGLAARERVVLVANAVCCVGADRVQEEG